MSAESQNGNPSHVTGGHQMEENLGNLLDDVGHLARYSVETVQLPASVDIEKIFEIRRKFEAGNSIDTKDFAELVRAYQVLEQRLGPVSASTLRATDDRTDFKSEASRYVNRLWWRTIVNIVLILSFHLIHHISLLHPNSEWWSFSGLISQYLIPFMYGALGADAFLLRETTHKLHLRQFDPRRIPENRCRFLLGTLSGGIIVLFVATEIAPNSSETFFPFAASGAALGFLAGYSIDFLFGTIERVISAILPKVVQTHMAEDNRAEDELLHKYRRLLDESQSDSDKQALKSFVEDLEIRART